MDSARGARLRVVCRRGAVHGVCCTSTFTLQPLKSSIFTSERKDNPMSNRNPVQLLLAAAALAVGAALFARNTPAAEPAAVRPRRRRPVSRLARSFPHTRPAGPRHPPATHPPGKNLPPAWRRHLHQPRPAPLRLAETLDVRRPRRRPRGNPDQHLEQRRSQR